jgi:predicted ABC-type ATPase
MANSPKLVIVGGANGVGKSTVALQYAKEFGIPYLGADEIAEELLRGGARRPEIGSGKAFFKRLEAFLSSKESVIIESTLSGTGLLRRIGEFRERGYSVVLVYIFLDSIRFCKRRVSIRVKKGGHNVAARDIKRRFGRSLSNFWNQYRHMADRWQLIYNGGDRPLEVAVEEKGNLVVQDDEYFRIFSKIVGIV